MLKAEDIAKYLNVSCAKAYSIMSKKDFPTIVFDRTKRVKRDDFLQWLENHKQKG